VSLDNCEFFADGHVHLYPWVSVEGLLDTVGRNLSALRKQSPEQWWAVLVVADPEGVGGYERLLRHGKGNGSLNRERHWVRESGDGRSVVFQGAHGPRILAIRGQQLITREGLEVLGAGYTNDIPSGLTLATTVERISAAGGWSTVAWGVAKWLGRRGRIVTNLIATEGGRRDIMLGDNGGRPWWWTRVPQFELAAERGMRILAGSDPLPLKGEEARVGSYAFRIQVRRTEGQSIMDAFRGALENPSIGIQMIGRRMGFSRVISNQIRLRLQRL